MGNENLRMSFNTKEILEKMNQGKITSITVSRCVKVPRNGGDTFISLTSSFEEGLDHKESEPVALLLSLKANEIAIQSALTCGLISPDEAHQRISYGRDRTKEILKEKMK